MWLPKSLLQSQLSHQCFLKEEPRQPKITQQWRPATRSTKPEVYQTTSANQIQKWVPKEASTINLELSSKPKPKIQQQWVPKSSSTVESVKSTTHEANREEPPSTKTSRLFKMFNPVFDLLALMSE